MFGLAFFSMLGDANTMDELAHTPAGYSYIIKQDMRLNPEHPPLLKDLAGLSVWLGSKITGEKINFPDQHPAWQNKVNGQWEFGRQFLFHSGNNADKIIFWARLPMLLLMILLGFYVFKWSRELYGNKAGLIALFLYSLSPTFLAHGRLVTTDVGAAAAFFISSYYLIKWLRQPTRKNLIIAGLVFGLALLTKFSLVLLIPYFILITLIWIFLERVGSAKKFRSRGRTLKLLPFAKGSNFKVRPLGNALRIILGLALIGIIAMALVWPLYQFHTLNYPPERQLADAEHNLKTYGNRLLAEPTIWLSDKPFLRPYGQFFTGLLMVIQRASGGNTTYFLGEISNVAWPHYFPIVFLLKIPLVLLILMTIALVSVIARRSPLATDAAISSSLSLRGAAGDAAIPWKKKHFLRSLAMTTKKYFTEFALLLFLAIYWYTSVTSNLNIGVRHILPTFPIIYLLISGQISKWLCLPGGPFLEKVKLTPKKLLISIKMTFKAYFKLCFKYLILIILLFWYGFSVINLYPYFLTYFNEFAGGPNNGYRFVTDSNLDWGQDLKRLAQFAEQNKIQTIYVDYFGGDDLQYRLGEKYQTWWGERDPQELPANSWLAVSASFLQGGRGVTTKGYQQKTGFYNWLNQYEPVTVIGNSIFVYLIP